MADECPVCGDAVEHVRVETPDLQSPSESVGGSASFRLDDLCSVTDDERWDRICTAATHGEEDSNARPVLEVYYHFFEDGEE